MRDRITNTRPFTFAEGNRNIKIRERYRLAKEVDLPLERDGWNWFKGRNFLPMSVDISKVFFPIWLWYRWRCSVF